MRYVLARYNEKKRAEIYRIYVTDCLQLIAENTAKRVEGRYISKRYIDIVDSTAQAENDKDGTEIAIDVIRRLGLSFSEGGNDE